MSSLIAIIVKWIIHKLGLLLIILGVLLVGAWLKKEWNELETISREIGQQEQVLGGLRADLDRIDGAIEADTRQWREQAALATQALAAELRATNARITEMEGEWLAAREKFSSLDRAARSAAAAAARAKARVEKLEQDFWFWDRFLSPQKVAALEAARARYAALSKTAQVWKKARDKEAPRFRRSPAEPLHQRRDFLEQEIDDRSKSVSPRHAGLAAEREQKQQEVQAVEGLLAAQQQRAAEDPKSVLLQTVKANLPVALGVLAGILLMPVLIRAFFYFVLAPLASRLPPIRILPNTRAPAIAAMPASAVSAAIDIQPGYELLLQPGFLQSSSQPAKKETKWFLNPRLPFSCIASGMFALTRIRPESNASTHVVVSSQDDAFGEIGVMELPEGAAMVIQPRSLAGIVKPDDRPVLISRHWRLASLHAWLTLQLRYLVFHGPCRLILKGCRGVQSEEPRPGQARLINQAATLGFSANLDYKTVRCETFIPYLRRREALFNDLFAGGPGRYVYEEMPADGRASGATARGIEGITDAVLKVFGI